jgi:hypothetical protein
VCTVALVIVAAPAVANAAPFTLDVAQDLHTLGPADNGVGAVGDVNGDGVPDTSANSVPNSSCAPLVITFRRAPDMDAAGGFEITDSARGCPSEAFVAPAGDVNGDGLGDIAIQPDQRDGAEGKLYVVFGKRDSAPVDLARLGTRGFAIEDSSHFHGSPGSDPQVADGDVNGDGLDDLLIHDGSTRRPPQVVFGKTGSESVDLHELGARGFAVAPPLGRRSGSIGSVAIVQDMNGDGRAEVVLAVGGSSSYKESNRGTFVIFGRTGSEPVRAGSEGVGFRIDRGGTIAGLGDVNGDRAGDLAVDSFIVFGKGDTGTVITGAGEFGGFRVTDGQQPCPGPFEEDTPNLAPAGDVNGDGLADVVLDCEVVFGKRDHDPVSLFTPSARGFVVKQAGRGVEDLIGIGDVTGDGRADLFFDGPDGGKPAVAAVPALLTAPVPISLGSAGPTAPVLCVARAGCVGDVAVRATDAAACADSGVARDEAVGRGTFQLAAGDFGAVPIAVSDSVSRLRPCLVGMSVIEDVSLAPPESPWTRELPSELVPDPLPAGPAWETRAQRTSDHRDLNKDLDLAFDASGRPYTLVSAGSLGRLRTWLFPPSGRPRRLGLIAASIEPFDTRRLLVAGFRRRRHRAVARYALTRGSVRKTRALDPGHTVEEPSYYRDALTLVANRHGSALAVIRRRRGRNGQDVVARFIGGGGRRRAQIVRRGAPEAIDAAIDDRGDAIVAWCDDPHPGFVMARNGGRFGKVHSLGANEDGTCGDMDIAIGRGGRYTIVWRTQSTPYNPPDGPVETRVTIGAIGGPVHSFTLDESDGDWPGMDADRVAVVYSGADPIVAWTAFDAVTGHFRARVEDLETRTASWLSLPDVDAVLGGMTESGGALAAVWGPISTIEDTDAVYASYAPRGLEFGAPERIVTAAPRHHIDGAPQIAFAPGSQTPYVAAVDAASSTRRFVFARRPG